MIKSILNIFIISISLTICTFSQSDNKSDALKLGKEGIKLVDEGNYDKGIELFEKAQKLDPDNILYPYEIAYAKVLQKKYNEAIDIAYPLKDHDDVIDEIFRLLGNSYDYLDDQEKALSTYNEGLIKFPNSGKLYHEKGISFLRTKNYDEALSSFENGIRVEPNYPSNYLKAATLYYTTENEIWALLYLETFICLEPGSKRSEEASKLLFSTYKKGLKFDGEQNVVVSFSQNPNLSSKDLLYFESNFEIAYGLALVLSNAKEVTIEIISRIRQAFLKSWYEKGFDKKYNVGLFDHVKMFYDKGYGTAYDYFNLGHGEPETVISWIEKNDGHYKNFENFYVENRLELSLENSVYRGK